MFAIRILLWLGCASYLLIGLAHVLLGSVLEDLITYYGIAYSQGSQLIFNQFAGFLVGVLATPYMLGRLGRKQTILLALILLTIAETVYGFLPPWGVMLTIGSVAGFGFGTIEAAIGALIIEFVTERKATAMSRLEVFFGIGALLMPAAAGLFIRYGEWRFAFPLVAVFSFMTLLLWWRVPLGAYKELMQAKKFADKGSTPAQKYTRRTLPILVLMISFFVIYVGAEMSFVHFVPSILIEHVGADASLATTSITAFWATMVVGRLFAGALGERLGYGRYLLIAGIGALGCFIAFSLSAQLAVSFTLILLLGLFMSGMFAIALIFTNARIPGLTERTTSLLVAAGGVGGALMPRIIGWTMDTYSLAVTNGILIGAALAMVLLVLAAIRRPSS